MYQSGLDAAIILGKELNDKIASERLGVDFYRKRIFS